MLVKDFMVNDVIKLHKEDSIKKVLETFVENKIGGLPLVDDNNKLVGIVTDGDVIRYIRPKSYGAIYIYYAENLDENLEFKSQEPVKHIMTKRVATLNENNSLEEALKNLSYHHYKKIPVVNNNNEVVGIISRGDIIKVLAKKTLKLLNENKK